MRRQPPGAVGDERREEPHHQGISAGATSPPASVTTVAPIMMIINPAAASGVRFAHLARAESDTRAKQFCWIMAFRYSSDDSGSGRVSNNNCRSVYSADRAESRDEYGARVSDPGARDPACTPFSLGSLLDVLLSGGSRRTFSPQEKDRVGESPAVRLPPQAERYPCSLGKRWSRPCGVRRLFQEKVGGPRIPEFFSRSVVSLVTAKGEPSQVE